MDVTSLLNANSMAGGGGDDGQKENDGSRPIRSRTPWDAGGYSLPIMSSNPASRTGAVATISPLTIPMDDSRAESPPTSHKFSDSRSSFSSFTSSIHSSTHSRFSSTSTVSGCYPIFSPKSTPTALESTSPSNDAFISETRPTPTTNEAPDILSTIAEHHIAPELEQQERDEHDSEGASNQTTTLPRPSSPSDAILIRRTTVPVLRLDTCSHNLNRLEPHDISKHYLSAPPENTHHLLSRPSLHKRALSAPGNIIMKESAIIRPQGELTPPSSLHPDNASPTIPLVLTASPVTPLTPLQEASNHGDVLNRVANEHNIVCMFQRACDTNSALRKAISHIFGRNKMCTRLVPPEVWVHYCRKHYQRSRYRNPKEYAKLQCDLVQKQIRRIHDWSLFNQRNGRPGVVQDWGLAVRKREQKRIDGLSGSKRKRSSSQYDDTEEDDDSPVPATAVPKWLRGLCGKGYDTHSILSIFNRLHTEILADLMPQFPDIEILPNIATELEAPQQPKAFVKRPVAVSGHKRSQSLGVGATPNMYSPISGPIRTNGWGSADGLPMQKRQRRSDHVEAAPESVTPTFGRRSLGSNRSGNSSVAENHSESGRMGEMRPHPNAYQPHLVAPTPQRHGGHSMAAHLETSSARRPVHHRSQSDVAGLPRGNDMYGGSQYTTSAHPSGMNGYGPSPFQQAPQNTFVINPTQPRGQLSKGPSQQPSMLSSKQLPSLEHSGRSGHSRHQSVPMAHFNRSPSGTSRDRDLSRGLPSINQSISNGNTLPPVIQVTESVQEASIFRERR